VPTFAAVKPIKTTTLMAKEKMQMEVGKRYKGYGVLNEYGEYLFTPCQKLEPSEKNMKIVRTNGSAI